MGPGLSLTRCCASSTPCGSDAARPPSTPAQLGAVGVTLTAASRVIFMEPDLSAAVEEQALSRVRRMGGGKDVWAKRLVSTKELPKAQMKVQKMEKQLETEQQVFVQSSRPELQSQHSCALALFRCTSFALM